MPLTDQIKNYVKKLVEKSPGPLFAAHAGPFP
jgi:hypothetical protein